MLVNRIILGNWRNFRSINVGLRERQFVVGPNAAGKSNFLDAFRFLRDVAKPEGGGVQKAVKDRGGVSKLRSLSARKDPEITIELHLSETQDGPTIWRYRLSIGQEIRGFRRPIVAEEKVWRDEEIVLSRPNSDDRDDPERLTQSFLEQVNENSQFRELVNFFFSTTYLHLVPQLLRHPELFQGRLLESDPFGQGFLERVAKTSPRIQKSRLARIETALKVAVPQLQQLRFERDDDTGRPHLGALYSHWRPNAGWQREDQFSDGTLRLIGLLWSLLESESLLLLEEPELSLNSAIVARLGPLIYRMQRQRRRQVIVSTHSMDLLSDEGIEAREVILLEPSHEGTAATALSDFDDLSRLMKAGLSAGEVVLPRTRPRQLDLFAALD
ncbi:AAA family ATPase [Brevundimonas sp. DWR2-3-1b1]|uniref:AAA family ATPase n=1 Tax=unclassified Brevundimonas TaxID=2622653 RepID=UPI003CFBB45D